MSDLPAVQEAVRRIDGVTSAQIRWPDPAGPASLRVEFAPGADHRRVGEAIMRTLVDVAHVDLSSVVLEHPDVADAAPRPVFTGLAIERTDDQLSVEVTLEVGAERLHGRASGVIGPVGEVGLVAEAALHALRDTPGGPFELLAVDRLEVDGDEVLLVAVGAGSSPTRLLGTAAAGRDAREGAVRAALDAVNRVLGLPDL